MGTLTVFFNASRDHAGIHFEYSEHLNVAFVLTLFTFYSGSFNIPTATTELEGKRPARRAPNSASSSSPQLPSVSAPT